MIFRKLRAVAENRGLLYFLIGVVFIQLPAHAVEMGGGYNATAPTNSDVANWNSSTAWGESGITGWDYVGQVNGASAVFIGSDWVLTAAHLNVNDSLDFYLGGSSYSVVAGSETGISNSDGTADLTLFQIASAPSLPALTISTQAPSTASYFNPGSTVVMIGYGGGAGETWGANAVTGQGFLVSVSGLGYESTDFATDYGTTAHGGNNTAQLVGGDSGGGDFIYNASTGLWNLAGINEGISTSSSDPPNSDSYMVQLSTYATQIKTITGISATPEPSTWALLFLGLAFLGICARARRGLQL